ncbi:hypothetical protein IW262DRAFT_1454672 [Armillaria fumosa]|nr:hypothetical protein IW262DRAFT_1454672 [Armillaria fumosa]
MRRGMFQGMSAVLQVAGPCFVFGIFDVNESESITVNADYNHAMPVIHTAVSVTANSASPSSASNPHPATQIVATQVSLPESPSWPTDSLPLYTATVLHKGSPALTPCQPRIPLLEGQNWTGIHLGSKAQLR